MPPRRRNSFVPTPPPQLPTYVPPGATDMATPSNGTTTTSMAESSTNISLHDMINAPSRRNQPLLHPLKHNGGLWFKIDPSICSHVQTVWQNNFMVPCWNWTDTPQHKKDKWWQDFMQHFYWAPEHHDLVYENWKKSVWLLFLTRISAKKRKGEHPSYVSPEQWGEMVTKWSTPEALEKSRINAKNRKSEASGFPMHKHSAGSRSFANIEWKMRLCRPFVDPLTEFVRKTHTQKEETFVDPLAEAIVSQVEEAATLITPLDTSSGSGTSTPFNNAINKTYLEVVKPRNRRIYGLGSVQDVGVIPSQRFAPSLGRSLDVEMRLSEV